MVGVQLRTQQDLNLPIMAGFAAGLMPFVGAEGHFNPFSEHSFLESGICVQIM